METQHKVLIGGGVFLGVLAISYFVFSRKNSSSSTPGSPTGNVSVTISNPIQQHPPPPHHKPPPKHKKPPRRGRPPMHHGPIGPPTKLTPPGPVTGPNEVGGVVPGDYHPNMGARPAGPNVTPARTNTTGSSTPVGRSAMRGAPVRSTVKDRHTELQTPARPMNHPIHHG